MNPDPLLVEEADLFQRFVSATLRADFTQAAKDQTAAAELRQQLGTIRRQLKKAGR